MNLVFFLKAQLWKAISGRTSICVLKYLFTVRLFFFFSIFFSWIDCSCKENMLIHSPLFKLLISCTVMKYCLYALVLREKMQCMRSKFCFSFVCEKLLKLKHGTNNYYEFPSLPHDRSKPLLSLLLFIK